MKFNLKKTALAVMFLAGGASAQAQTVPVAKCALTGPGVAACTAAAVVLHEGIQAGNDKQPFGPNGEGMKVINGAGDVVADIFGWSGKRRSGPATQEEINEIKSWRLERALK